MTETTSNKAILQKTCVYCGSRKRKLTKDHVPPKCLFAKPLPQDLITVPCCLQCNKGASKDDEYFRARLVAREDAGEHPEARKVQASVLRALQRPQARGFTKEFLGAAKKCYVVNVHGVIEPRVTFDPGLQRIVRVASRIVRGLFWKEYGVRLPDNYETSSFNDSGMDRISLSRDAQEIVDSVLEQGPKTVGRGVFKYWGIAVPEDKCTTAWLLLFYESVFFLCFTTQREAELRRIGIREV